MLLPALLLSALSEERNSPFSFSRHAAQTPKFAVCVRILFYSPHPTHDIVSEVGYSTHQRETIHAFRELGHEVLPLIMGGTTPSEKKVFVQQGLKFRLKELFKKVCPPFLFNGLKDYGIRRFDRMAADRLRDAIADFKPDLVYERSEYMQDSGVRICTELGVKHFLEVNAPFIEEMAHWEGPSVLHGLGHRIEKRKLVLTSHVFVVSGVLRDFLAERYRVPLEKMTLIPNCINPDAVITDENKIQSITKRYDLLNKKVIGFVGSFFPHHGLDWLIDAFHSIEAKYPDTVLLIVGGGMNEAELKKQASEKLGADRVVFAGRVPHSEVYNYISAMDIAVMPKSNWYGSPMKIFEYGALGKTVVAPHNGPVTDVMEHLKDGFLTEPGTEALAAALAYLLSHRDTAEEAGRHFREKIFARYTWTRQAETILSHCTSH